MDKQEFTQALARLSEFKIGLNEAVVLFACEPGCTNRELHIMLDLPMEAVWARTSILKNKKLIQSKYNENGRATHTLTSRGRKLIERVTQIVT